MTVTRTDTPTAGPTPRTASPYRGVPGPGISVDRPRGPARPGRILCLDIETVADGELLPPDWPEDRFPKPCWHSVVAIAFAEARIESGPGGTERYVLESCRSGGEPGWSEERLLRGFWQRFAGGDYRLVTWNGRSFDLPVLLTRAFLYGIPTGAFYLRGDRWAGYDKRFAPQYHGDLMELMSSYGAATRMGLEDMAVAMGLPGKAGEHGSHVAAMIADGRIDDVRAYCETDVLNTFALYCRWGLISGQSDIEGHDAGVSAMVHYLSSERRARPHLGAFLDRWRASRRPAPMMLRRTDGEGGTG